MLISLKLHLPGESSGQHAIDINRCFLAKLQTDLVVFSEARLLRKVVLCVYLFEKSH